MARWTWIAGSVVAAAAIGVAGYLLMPVLGGPKVVALTVQKGQVIQSIVASGQVETPARVMLGSQMTGTAETVNVEEGALVKAGQILVTLHDEDAKASLMQAEAQVRQAQIKRDQIASYSLPAAQQTLVQSRLAEEDAARQLARISKLAEQGFVAQSKLDEERRLHDVAVSQRNAAELAIANLGADGLESANSQALLDQTLASMRALQAKLELTRIVAPVDGMVIARMVDPGMVVQPGAPLLELAPATAKRLVVQIDERNLREIRIGQNALASADAFPDVVFPAKVSVILPSVDPLRGSFEVKLALSDPPDFLIEGMSVSVDIELRRSGDALVVANEAIRNLSGNAADVFVADQGRAVLRQVRIGIQGTEVTEILAGLAAGELVIPRSVSITDGARIRLVDRPSP